MSSESFNRKDEYWADAPADRLAHHIKERTSRYVNYVDNTGLSRIWRRSMRMYYGSNDRGDSSNAVKLGGEQGELLRLRANLFRAYTQARLTLIGGSWPSMQVRTNADDSRSSDQVSIGTPLLDDCSNRIAKMAHLDALLYALLYGEGHVDTRWNHYHGKAYAVGPDNQEIREGEATMSALTPDRVIRDPDVKGRCGSRDWVILRSVQSRFTLAARFPEFRDDILSAPLYDHWTQIEISDDTAFQTGSDHDQVAVYEFWHDKTDAIPDGRYAMVVGDAVLIDQELPYPRLPIASIVTDQQTGRAVGYGDAWDLMGLQEIQDSIISILASVRENFGAIDIWTPPDANLEAEDLAPGFRWIKAGVKPETIQHGIGYAAESQSAIDIIDNVMKTIAKVNPVIVGDAGKSQSGAALMTMQASAQQANSLQQSSFFDAIQQSMTLYLWLVKTYQKAEKMVPIVGRLKLPTVRRFKGSDIDSLDGVQIELSNPLLNTNAGKLQTADTLLQRGAINPDQYLGVAITGRLESATRSKESQLRLIERENELMSQGIEPVGSITDNHPMHIDDHRCELDDPDVRADSAQLAARTAHLTWHLETWPTMSLDLCAALGIPPAPSSQMQGPPPGGPGGPQPTQGPPPDAQSANAAPQPNPEPSGPPPSPQGGEQGLPNQPNAPAEMPQIPPGIAAN